MSSKEAFEIFKQTGKIIDYLVYLKVRLAETAKI